MQGSKTTSTRASFFSSLFAVARIALIAFAVTSSPESELTGQLPRYFTCQSYIAAAILLADMIIDNLKLDALHNRVDLTRARILQQF